MRRRFGGAAVTLTITSHEIVVRFPNRAQDSLLPVAGFDEEATPKPMPGRKHLRFPPSFPSSSLGTHPREALLRSVPATRCPPAALSSSPPWPLALASAAFSR